MMKNEKRKDRFTWKKGDVILTDRNGRVIDLDKLGKKEGKREEDQR